ncbi:hypothetical protein [Streptomyces filipinensis]|uniref:hypothetical protein n=1 Tax=Streptomyces filipinensis TaxID=66887 RepID=UPI00177E0AB8|nr:hypothetical protein [Streptomyces filipinensis]
MAPVTGRLLPLFRLGSGGLLGPGDRYRPFVSLSDRTVAQALAALDLVLDSAPRPVG